MLTYTVFFENCFYYILFTHGYILNKINNSISSSVLIYVKSDESKIMTKK